MSARRRIDEGIGTLFRTLLCQPSSGRRREELAPGMRSFPYGRYTNAVEIVRVLDGVAISSVLLRVTQDTLIRVRDASDIRLKRWKNSSSCADLPD
jgi:plasmid stabilization system protein ParE